MRSADKDPGVMALSLCGARRPHLFGAGHSLANVWYMNWDEYMFRTKQVRGVRRARSTLDLYLITCVASMVYASLLVTE